MHFLEKRKFEGLVRDVYLGIISRALAIAPIKSCSFPAMVREKLRRVLESSISMAPPPATTASFFTMRLTTMIAS